MPLHWRDTLLALLPQFQAKASGSTGIFHLMVEVADSERDKMLGPPWFGGLSRTPPVVNGEPQYQRWDCSRFTGLPGVSPSFREPMPGEKFSDSDRVIRDKSGIVRACFVPPTLRTSYFCGRPSEEVTAFESLANMAALALLDADDLSEHFFASELCDLFRPPHGGVRYVFGEVSEVPTYFIAKGWGAGVLQYENGVLIDLPIGESEPDSTHWMLLLHRLGWKRPKGSPLIAHRACWDGNIEVTFDMLDRDWSGHPKEFAKQFTKISKRSFYSVLGSKDAPIDVHLASAFAVQLLTAELSARVAGVSIAKPVVDYSDEAWNRMECPPVQSVGKNAIKGNHMPQIGIVVATEVERHSVLCRLKPPQSSRSVLQVFEGNNTYYIGRLGATRVVLVMSAMGSVGRDASAIVTSELLEHWDLEAVVMVGIAFGKDAGKQMIGGVLVSERIINYEPERLGAEESLNRGEEHKAGSLLLNRFRNVLGWSFTGPLGVQCSHQIGPMLSGEKLLDNAEKKSALFSRYPTAIGGEMEGAGFAAAAERRKCEWIVVKAICDWGDGTKQKHHQGFAAAAAVDLLTHVLNQVGALDALRRKST